MIWVAPAASVKLPYVPILAHRPEDMGIPRRHFHTLHDPHSALQCALFDKLLALGVSKRLKMSNMNHPHLHSLGVAQVLGGVQGNGLVALVRHPSHSALLPFCPGIG